MNIKKAIFDDELGAVCWKGPKGEFYYTLVQDDGTIDFEDPSCDDYPASLMCHIRSTFG